MNIEMTQSGQRMTLSLEGRFDFDTHRAFRTAMKEVVANPAVREVKIDLGKVSFMDSSALGMLLLSREHCLAADKTVSLANPMGTVRDVLRICNFEKLFLIE